MLQSGKQPKFTNTRALRAQINAAEKIANNNRQKSLDAYQRSRVSESIKFTITTKSRCY